MSSYLISTAGGVLIGLATVLLMATLGRIAGISGIVGGLCAGRAPDWAWRLAFALGLVVGPLLLLLMQGNSGIGAPQIGWPWMAVAGLLVGVGTRLGSGCTSGHGVCGIARLSPRSLIATAVFMGFGALTVFLVRHLLGGL